MKFVSRSLQLCSFLVSLASAYPTLASRQSTPIPPSKDPFYTAPPSFELAAPGTPLRFRQAPGNFTTVFANCSAAYNILYRTTDSHYQPSWAVTTLFVPAVSPQSNVSNATTNATAPGNALVSYQFPYDSDDLDSSPSYLFYSSPPPAASDISTLLGNGWFVTSADYEGPQAALAAGVNTGHGVIDSIRAVLQTAGNSSTLGLSPDAQIALWGYSGGALASEWAAELAVQYAPELSIVGTAIGGLPANITAFIDASNKGPFAGLIPAGLVGLSQEWPDFRSYLLSHLNPTGPFNASGFLAVSNLSVTEYTPIYENQDIFSYFIGGQSDLNDPFVQHIFNNDVQMGYHGIPQMPLFVYMAIGDEVVGVASTDTLVQRWCGVGVNMLYQRNEVGGHADEDTNGNARALAWLSAVLEGRYGEVYPTVGCTVQNVSVNVTDTGL